jgi:AraC-like DNA-binding protein
VPHDGRSVTTDGFRKRVVYLDADTLDVRRIGRSVDHPGWEDAELRGELHLLHEAMRHPGDEFEAEGRLALVTQRLTAHLEGLPEPAVRSDPGLAARLQDLLDAHVVDGISLASAADELGAHQTHLVRAFRREVGIPPHRYLTGRRVDRARRLLLAGDRPADVAAEVGFHDQAHLTRHFRRMLGVTPGAYAASA